MKAEFKKFSIGNRINVGVVRPGAVPRHQQGHTLMQVVHHGWVPLIKHSVHGFCGFVGLLMRIAVDIDEGVLRPVGRRLAGKRGAVSFALEIAIEPVHHLVPAIGIGNGIDQHDYVFPDSLDHRLLRCNQPVREFDHGFG